MTANLKIKLKRKNRNAKDKAFNKANPQYGIGKVENQAASLLAKENKKTKVPLRIQALLQK